MLKCVHATSEMARRRRTRCGTGQTRRRDPATHSRPGREDNPALIDERAQGMPGAGRTRRPCGLKRKGAHKSVQAGRNIRHSLRNGFTAAPRSPWSTGLVSLHRLLIPAFRPQGRNRIIGRLDPSVGGSGPHGLTVRAHAARLAAQPASIASRATFVTTAKRLFGKRGMASLNHVLRHSEMGIFLRYGIDRRFWKSAKCFARRAVAATVTLIAEYWRICVAQDGML